VGGVRALQGPRSERHDDGRRRGIRLLRRAAAAPRTPPPLPTATAAAPGPDAIRRLVALTIAAARADGELGEEEYGRILAAAREHGAEKLVQAELAERRTVQEIVVGANDPALRARSSTRSATASSAPTPASRPPNASGCASSPPR
jgi:uncharacterized membrane protein YebE (DUF533 family)